MATLKQIDVQEVQDALNRVWSTGKCPFSGHEDWTIVSELVEIKPFQRGGLTIGGNVYPAVMVACNGCGYIALFSAVVLGLTTKEEMAGG